MQQFLERFRVLMEELFFVPINVRQPASTVEFSLANSLYAAMSYCVSIQNPNLMNRQLQRLTPYHFEPFFRDFHKKSIFSAQNRDFIAMMHFSSAPQPSPNIAPTNGYEFFAIAVPIDNYEFTIQFLASPLGQPPPRLYPIYSFIPQNTPVYQLRIPQQRSAPFYSPQTSVISNSSSTQSPTTHLPITQSSIIPQSLPAFPQQFPLTPQSLPFPSEPIPLPAFRPPPEPVLLPTTDAERSIAQAQKAQFSQLVEKEIRRNPGLSQMVASGSNKSSDEDEIKSTLLAFAQAVQGYDGAFIIPIQDMSSIYSPYEAGFSTIWERKGPTLTPFLKNIAESMYTEKPS
ncbi:hypothetical protein BLNAU_19184 [Blattamonas nauphoetae]|uniref:Uncharacterized protein n=1 Tax=Blattamonas nauphoetae TaxID=2049346 RepID=A0ABQ9X2R9_9EUKA|nr:hypothetical protein BLNAU_19184 [Blattamonas nauphoetae]